MADDTTTSAPAASAPASTVWRLERLRHDGLTFDVLDEGPLDGEVVVLLHGFPQRSRSWSAVAERLHARGLRTVAMDQRGYSPGARPRRRRAYAGQLLVADAVALAEAVGRPVHVVGHDWGAVPAWGLAGTRPDLVRSLVAVSVPHPGAFVASMLRDGQILKSWYMGFFQLPRVPELLARRRGGLMDLSLRQGGMTRAEVDTFRTEMVDDGALPGGLGWYRGLPFGDRSLFDVRVSVPTTMVWSDGDDFVGRGAVDRTEARVDAPYGLVVLEGVNHWIPTQAPDALAEAILARVDSAS